MLQYIPLSEALLEKIKHSDMGHWAIGYLCYKIITPARYAVTLGKQKFSIFFNIIINLPAAEVYI